MSDINLKQVLFDQQMKQIEDDIVPFGYIDDGRDEADLAIDNNIDRWQIQNINRDY